MTKQESKLKSQFMEIANKELPGFVLLRHEDVRSGGIPDLSITGFRRTSWWEFKHGTPKFETNGLQETTCLRLAGAGICYYVIYQEDASKRILIVHPKNIKTLIPETSCIGFNHRFLTEFIKQVHRVPGT